MTKNYYKVEDYEVRKGLGYLVRRARNLMTSGLESLFDSTDTKGITFAQWAVLVCIRDKIATTPAELCQTTYYDSGALTRLLDQLERRRLIKRSRSTKDRRVIRLRLTPEGRNTIKNMMGSVINFYNVLLENFTEKEADTLVNLLTRLITNLSERHARKA